MLSDAILMCENLQDLARLFLGKTYNEDLDQIPVSWIKHQLIHDVWPTNNGAVLRHIFKLIQTESDPEVLRAQEWYQTLLKEAGFTNIPMSSLFEMRVRNLRLKDKLVWFPEGMEPK